MTTLTPEGALTGIQELLDGTEWTVDMLDDIAALLRMAGYRVRDVLDAEESTDDVPDYLRPLMERGQ